MGKREMLEKCFTNDQGAFGTLSKVWKLARKATAFQLNTRLI